MKYFFSIFLFFTIFTNLSAQNFADKKYYLIDSLVLEDLNVEDSTLLETQLKAYHADKTFHRLVHLDSIIKNSIDYSLFKKYNIPYWEESSKYINDFKEGTEPWNEVMTHYANGVSNNAIKFDYAKKLDSALYYYNVALDLYKQLELNQNIGETMIGIATIYRKKEGKYIEAFEMASESFKYLDTNNINTSIAYSNFANFQLGQQNYDDAIHFNLKALSIAENLNEKSTIITTLSNIASLKRYQGKLEEADSIIHYAILEMNSIENIAPVDYIFVIDELGQLLIEKGEIDSAQLVIEEILHISDKNDFVYDYIFANKALAEIALLKKDYNKSEMYAKTAYELATQYELTGLIIHSLDVLVDVAIHNNQYKLALKYQKEQTDLEDQVYNKNKKETALKQSIQFQYEKQKEIDDLKNEQKLELAEQQKQKTRFGMIAAGVFALLISVFSIYTINRLKLIRNQKAKLDEAYVDLDAAYLKLEESTKNELAVSNLKALKSQMNPHFIFNLLNSIQALVLKGDIDASYNYMTKFATLVRQTLHFSDLDLVELDDEIDLLRIYLDLEKLRFSKNFEYQIIDNDIEGIEIPPLLIQPFIENALVHGLLHKEGQKTLKIEFILEDKLTCIITDNGIGRKKSSAIKERQNNQHKSFSTTAIEKRFKILSETYKDEFGFEYTDIEEGEELIATQVKLIIPYKRIF